MTSALNILGERGIAHAVRDDRGTWAITGEAALPDRIMGAVDATDAVGNASLYVVSSFADGQLLTISHQDGVPVVLGVVSTAGSTPCAIAVSPRGDHLAVANYRNGTVGIHPISLDGMAGEAHNVISYSGSGPDTRRQDGPHVHFVRSAGVGGLLSVDLGTDTVRIHQWEPDGVNLGQPIEGMTLPGAGPRHAAVTDEGWVVTADELGSSVSLFEVDSASCRIELRDRQKLPDQPRGKVRDYPSDAVVIGQNVYVATRGSDVITQLILEDGRLVIVDEVPSGRWPMKLEVVGTQLLCAARDDDEIRVWDIDPSSGHLINARVAAEYPRPVWLASVPETMPVHQKNEGM